MSSLSTIKYLKSVSQINNDTADIYRFSAKPKGSYVQKENVKSSFNTQSEEITDPLYLIKNVLWRNPMVQGRLITDSKFPNHKHNYFLAEIFHLAF